MAEPRETQQEPISDYQKLHVVGQGAFGYGKLIKFYSNYVYVCILFNMRAPWLTIDFKFN